jgi:hypothetical protein
VQRRELSQLLLASSAASALAVGAAQAQTSPASGYPRTPAEIAAGVTPTNIIYPQGDVRRYGADPTGGSDSTAAIQSALNVAANVYLAAGTYLITSPLTNAIPGRRIYGDGPQVSTLKPSGPISTLVNSANYLIVMDNFGIVGDSTTLDAITQSTGSTIDSCIFQNLFVHVGGRAIYFFEEFSTQIINCNASSYNNNVFELKGGNTTRLSGCYASQVSAGFYGYRIYGGAQMDSCNGIDTPNGGDWGLFGAAISKGDPVNAGFAVTLTNCNIEDFNNYGLRFRGTGYAKISGGAVQAKASGTYQAEFYVEFTNNLVIIENVLAYSKGATRAKRAAIFADANSYIMVVGDNVAPVCDLAGKWLVTLPGLQASVPTSANHNALHITNLDVDFLFNRYSGTVTLSGGAAIVNFVTSQNTGFVTPQFDAAYVVSLAGSANETFYITNKTVNGFQINSSNPSSTASVDWTVVRTPTIWPYARAS